MGKYNRIFLTKQSDRDIQFHFMFAHTTNKLNRQQSQIHTMGFKRSNPSSEKSEPRNHIRSDQCSGYSSGDYECSLVVKTESQDCRGEILMLIFRPVVISKGTCIYYSSFSLSAVSLSTLLLPSGTDFR